MRMDYDTLKVSLNNGIAQIEINRPEKKNALTQAM
jgi:enoyl-CoA hydratase/carnithine racemase